MKKYLTPMMFRLSGKNAGIFCAAIRRLLMIGELESCARSQAEVSVRTLIEAIQLPQARSLRGLFILVEIILAKADIKVSTLGYPFVSHIGVLWIFVLRD